MASEVVAHGSGVYYKAPWDVVKEVQAEHGMAARYVSYYSDSGRLYVEFVADAPLSRLLRENADKYVSFTGSVNMFLSSFRERGLGKYSIRVKVRDDAINRCKKGEEGSLCEFMENPGRAIPALKAAGVDVSVDKADTDKGEFVFDVVLREKPEHRFDMYDFLEALDYYYGVKKVVNELSSDFLEDVEEGISRFVEDHFGKRVDAKCRIDEDTYNPLRGTVDVTCFAEVDVDNPRRLVEEFVRVYNS